MFICGIWVLFGSRIMGIPNNNWKNYIHSAFGHSSFLSSDEIVASLTRVFFVVPFKHKALLYFLFLKSPEVIGPMLRFFFLRFLVRLIYFSFLLFLFVFGSIIFFFINSFLLHNIRPFVQFTRAPFPPCIS